MAGRPPRAPSHLQPATRRWWSEMVEAYALESWHLRLLTLAAEAWDRGEEARRRIAADGSYLADRFGQLRAHPAVLVERDARLSFARLVREIGLEDSEPPADVRPPRLAGRYA